VAPTPADLLAGALRRAPAAPLLTWYDDAADERVELSATTFANWVAKTANLLQDEFDVGPGSLVSLALPVHWQTAAALLAVWSCGAAVLDTAAEDDGRLADVDLVLVSQNRIAPLEDAGLGGDDGVPLLGLSLHPLGLGMRDYAGSARDFALEVRTAGDVFVPYQPPRPDDPGLLAGGLELSLASLAAAAGELAQRLGLAAGDRVLVEDRTAAEAGPVAWLLAPLAAGASLVLVGSARPERLAHRAETERVTATLGVNVPGVRELGRPA
jgi:uncharacterized protein (TIGR03089 family)